MKRLRWDTPGSGRSLPKRPYRDTALVYGGMSIIIVLIAWATAGDLRKALVIALGFFVVATAWSWRNWHRRLLEERRRKDTEGVP